MNHKLELYSVSHMNDFFDNNIGQIETICPDIDSDNLVYVIYFGIDIPGSVLWFFNNLYSTNKFLSKVNHELLPTTYKNFFYLCYKDDIEYFSSDKKDLESIIFSKKYNL